MEFYYKQNDKITNKENAKKNSWHHEALITRDYS